MSLFVILGIFWIILINLPSNILGFFGIWLILTIISINLIGFLVRGLFSVSELKVLLKDDKTQHPLKSEIKKDKKTEQAINLIATLALVAYIWGLIHYFNYGVAGVALIQMVTRIPDLTWEIKTGVKVTRRNAPKNIYSNIALLISLLSPILLYYSLFNL